MSIVNFQQFFKKIDVERKVADVVKDNMDNLALMFEAEVKERTPVRTGRLKNSMVGEVTGAFSARVSTNVVYAPYVEYGTSRSEPRAMIRNGAESMKTKGLDFLKDKLKNLS